MTRYTQAEVDESLAQVERGVFTPHAQIVLAAEVAVLRSHEALTNDTAADLVSELERMQESIDLYRATIARVEALPAKWLDYVAYYSGGVPDCAKDLEDALQPPAEEPPP